MLPDSQQDSFLMLIENAIGVYGWMYLNNGACLPDIILPTCIGVFPIF